MRRHWKKLIFGGLICILAVAAFLPAFAEEEPPVGVAPLTDEPLSDFLGDAKDVRWYSFEMTEQGSGVIQIQSCQKVWTGYTYYWYATVYAADQETVVAETSVRGASYLTTLTTGELAAGNYYLQMRSVAYNNPLMGGFTDEPFELTLRKYYYSADRVYEHDGVQVVNSADELICKLGTAFFEKVNDGMAYVALYRNEKGAIVPILIGETAESVEYRVSDGTSVNASNITFEYKGKEYYYSAADSVPAYEYDESAYPMYFSYSQSQAGLALAKEALEQYEICMAGGEWNYFWQNNWKWVAILGAVALVILIAALREQIADGLSDVASTRRSSSSADSGSYTNAGTNKSSREIWDEIDVAKEIAKRINTPGYDPESFGPDPETPPADPESFPPSGDIW